MTTQTAPMTDMPADPTASQKQFRDIVQDDECFGQLLAGFVESALARTNAVSGYAGYDTWLRAALEKRMRADCAVIDAFQTGSLEKIMLRALLLGGLKWDVLGLVYMPFERDPPAGMRAYRMALTAFHGQIEPLLAQHAPWASVASALTTALAGQSATATREALEMLALRAWLGRAPDLVVLTLQPEGLALELEGSELKTDLYFEALAADVPALAVECTGFGRHWRSEATYGESKEAPAEEQEIGMLRFPGMDIFRDAIAVASHVLKFLPRAAQGPAPSQGTSE